MNGVQFKVPICVHATRARAPIFVLTSICNLYIHKIRIVHFRECLHNFIICWSTSACVRACTFICIYFVQHSAEQEIEEEKTRNLNFWQIEVDTHTYAHSSGKENWNRLKNIEIESGRGTKSIPAITCTTWKQKCAYDSILTS